MSHSLEYKQFRMRLDEQGFHKQDISNQSSHLVEIIQSPSNRVNHVAVFIHLEKKPCFAFIGGQNSSTLCDTTLLYFPTTNAWKQLDLPEPVRRIHAAALPWHKGVLLFGGVSSLSSPSPTAHLFSWHPSTNQWTRMEPLSPPFPHPRCHAHLMVNPHHLSIMKGHTMDDTPIQGVDTLEWSSMKWTNHPHPLSPNPIASIQKWMMVGHMHQWLTLSEPTFDALEEAIAPWKPCQCWAHPAHGKDYLLDGKEAFHRCMDEQTILVLKKEKHTLQGKWTWQRGPLIGRGAHSTVYLSLREDGYMGVEKRMDRTESNMVHIEAEQSALALLDHVHLIDGMDQVEEKDSISLFVPWVPGGPIASIVEQYTISETLAQTWMRELVSAVASMHAVGLAHRDLKGDNVLLGLDGHVQLTDFGSSDRGQTSDSVTGTPHFMAPEQIQGVSVYDGQKADTWALGCVLIQMATGKPPNAHLSPTEALFQMHNQPPMPPANWSADAHDFCMRCFTVDPSLRWSVRRLKEHIWIQEKEMTWKLPMGLPQLQASGTRGAFGFP